MLIFPSGATTNGSRILKFKRGPFVAEKSVQPFFMKIDQNATISAAYDVCDIPEVAIMMFCCFGFQTIELGILPPF